MAHSVALALAKCGHFPLKAHANLSASAAHIRDAHLELETSIETSAFASKAPQTYNISTSQAKLLRTHRLNSGGNQAN
jgi:hypothetical protein